MEGTAEQTLQPDFGYVTVLARLSRQEHAPCTPKQVKRML
jgi:hypothetical protein